MPKPPRLFVCAIAALALPLAACSGGSDKTSQGPASTTPTAASVTPASETPSATTPTTPPASTPPPAVPARTAAQLGKALLALADLPAGFAIEPDDGAGDTASVKLSSKDPKCKRLVALSNADNPPGSKASAGRSYSGGAQGPYIDETLDAMGSAAAVRALQRSFQQAIASCRTMTLTVPGQGRSPISVRPVSAPAAGTNPVAVRYTATSGPLEGLEVTMVTTGIDDVVLALTVVEGAPEDIDGATTAAADKAKSVLGVRSGT